MAELVVERSDGVVTVTFNRPEKKNAVNAAMWDAFGDALAGVDPGADRVVVVTGSGDSFCSGQDLTDGENLTRVQADPLAFMRTISAYAQALHDLPIPTIAAVNGVAAGAGANLALGCDFVVCARSARFSQIFVQRGLTIDFGGSVLLPALVGLRRAKELALLGGMCDADRAERIGLVNEVVADADLMATVRDLAQQLLALAPRAVQETKRLLHEAVGASALAEALDRECVAQAELFESDDTREAVMAFFEGRTPVFRGR